MQKDSEHLEFFDTQIRPLDTIQEAKKVIIWGMIVSCSSKTPRYQGCQYAVIESWACPWSLVICDYERSRRDWYARYLAEDDVS